MQTFNFKGWKINRSGILSHPLHKTYDIKCNTTARIVYFGKRYEIHRVIWCISHNMTEVPEGYHVHHIDKVHSNNRPDNLVALPKQAHLQAHKIYDKCAVIAHNNRRIKYPFKEYDTYIQSWKALGL